MSYSARFNLGRLLFLLYMNGMSEVVESWYSLNVMLNNHYWGIDLQEEV